MITETFFPDQNKLQSADNLEAAQTMLEAFQVLPTNIYDITLLDAIGHISKHFSFIDKTKTARLAAVTCFIDPSSTTFDFDRSSISQLATYMMLNELQTSQPAQARDFQQQILKKSTADLLIEQVENHLLHLFQQLLPSEEPMNYQELTTEKISSQQSLESFKQLTICKGHSHQRPLLIGWKTGFLDTERIQKAMSVSNQLLILARIKQQSDLADLYQTMESSTIPWQLFTAKTFFIDFVDFRRKINQAFTSRLLSDKPGPSPEEAAIAVWRRELTLRLFELSQNRLKTKD